MYLEGECLRSFGQQRRFRRSCCRSQRRCRRHIRLGRDGVGVAAICTFRQSGPPSTNNLFGTCSVNWSACTGSRDSWRAQETGPIGGRERRQL